jgi:hypothetical protein
VSCCTCHFCAQCCTWGCHSNGSHDVRRSCFYNDVLVYDSKTAKLTNPNTPFPKGIPGRANHTATLVGNKIWFIGGGDNDMVYGDVFTLDINTWTWQRVTVRWERHRQGC